MQNAVYMGRGRVLVECRHERHFMVSSRDRSVGWHLMLHGEHEPHVTGCLSELVRPGMVGVIAGANYGWHAVNAAHHAGPDGLLYCFEPVPTTVELLRFNLAINGVAGRCVVETAALWDCTTPGNAEQPARFYVAVDPANVGGATVCTPPSPAAGLCYATPTWALDDYFSPDSGRRLPEFLKLDVEGAEYRALCGARRLLASRTLHFIVLEWLADRWTDEQWSAVTAMLKDYALCTIDSAGALVRVTGENLWRLGAAEVVLVRQ